MTREDRAVFCNEFAARLRRLFPDGRLRSHLRSIYRKVNTAPGQGTNTPEDLRVLDKLTEMYGPANEELAQRFGLDLSEWH